MFIKVYISKEEKEQIEKSAKASGASSLSGYIKAKAFADDHQRATLVECVSCMIRLVEANEVSASVSENLLAVAQKILDGQPIPESRAKIAEICSLADQSN